MPPRRKYQNLLTSNNYANPAFGLGESSAPSQQPWSDPLPSSAQFEPLRQRTTNDEPLIPIPPSAPIASPRNIGVAMTSSPPIVSPVSPEPVQRVTSRESMASMISTSNPASPVAEKRPSRFHSDFHHFTASFQKSPDPAFRSHRRTFSEEANKASYKTSEFREEGVEEEARDEITSLPSKEPTVTMTHGRSDSSSTADSIQSASATAPSGLGLRYVPVDEGVGKPSKKYGNFSPDDDDMSDDAGSIKKEKPTRGWLYILILLLCIYSTIGSLFFFVVAAARPRYGTWISAQGKLKPQDAQLISAILAKTIELSFVSVFVSFLGQVLSRRALMSGSKGVNIAELSMRTWVTQPGSLITHTTSLRFAGLTFLGALSLTATVFASFYTTASDTLVSPKLNWGSPQLRELVGIVQTSYANSTYRGFDCETIVTAEQDPADPGYVIPQSQASCTNLLTAGNGYRDVSDFIAHWKRASKASELSMDPKKRTAVVSSHDSVRYSGQWISVTGENGVNNASLVMPHGGLVAATRNSSLNGILQPEDAEGYGSFTVNAAIGNPGVNALCVPLTSSQVRWFIANPIVRDTISKGRNGTASADVLRHFNFSPNATYVYNGSDPNTVSGPFEAPRFPIRPIAYNSVVWGPAYGDPSVYMLIRPDNETETYTMCGIKSFFTPFCSTQFRAVNGGGNATVNCDEDNQMTFIRELRKQQNDTDDNLNGDRISRDFQTVGIELILSTALGTGVSSGNASIARLFSNFALGSANDKLLDSQPSLAEALASMFSNAIITSSVDSDFSTPFFPAGYASPYENRFMAEVATIEYSSGAGSGWKPLFYVVLGGVLLMNIFCLLYFSCVRDGFVTDWTEVENLFCVAMDGGALSKSDQGIRDAWKGSGGTGPAADQYKVGVWFTEQKGRWYITDSPADSEKDIAMSSGFHKMV